MMGLEFRDVLLALALIGQIANAAWLYIERRNDKTNERISDLSKKVSEMDKDVATLAASGRSAPTHHDLGKMYEAQKKSDETLNKLVGETAAQTAMMRMIMSHLIKGAAPE